MARRRRRVAWALALVLALAQLVPVRPDNPPVPPGQSLREDAAVPAVVRAALQRSCWDCHSSETRWPWYAHVAPVSWLVVHDTREGRREMNLSEWALWNDEAKEHARRGAWKHVEKGDMPPAIYLAVHRASRPSPADRVALEAWAAASTGAPEGGEAGEHGPAGHGTRLGSATAIR